MKKYFVCIAVISAIMALSAISAFSQDSQAPAKDSTAGQQGAAVQATPAAPATTTTTTTTATTSTPAVPAVPASAPQAAPAEPAAKQAELSIYGEVQVVNAAGGSISVQYYDYDNDEEKTIEILISKDSKLENVKTIGEIKKGDWVDVTYVVTDGKNMAKIVSVEVEEPAAGNNAPVDTAEEQ